MMIVQVWAQTKTVTGKVTDESGGPVAGASIIVKGTRLGTTSGSDGSFTLSVPSTASAITVSFAGYSAIDVSVTKSNNVAVRLISNSAGLDNIVVVGYGSAKKKSDVAGSVTQISAEKIQEKPVANLLDALQGKVAGLQVYTSSGEPSATPTVRFNGVGSLGASSTPLYVLDGIPIDAGTIISLNPEDMQSITVLKDASATSIYGSRAANGVIYYTTKKGSANKSQVTLQTQYSVSNLIKSTKDLFNSFMNTKQFTDFQVASGQQTQAQVNATLATYHADTKWYKSYYKENAPTYSANLGVSGGGGKTTYYVSGSYFKQEGLAYRSGYERYTFRSNVTTAVTNWLKMGINLSGGYDKRQANPYGSNSTNRGLAFLAQPYYSPLDSNGNKIYGLIPGWNRYAPEYLADKVQANQNNVQLNPTGYIEVTPVKNLILKSQGGMDFYDYRLNSVRYPSYIGALNSGQVSEEFDRGITKTITNTAEYRFNIAKRHSFTALAGQEFIRNTTTQFISSSSGQTDDRLVLLSAGPSSITATSSRTEYSYLSYFGRLNYNLNQKYYLDFSIRNDQSSRFGKDLRGATFYSVGAQWKIKEESFLSNTKWLTDLNIKASIGTNGNSAIDNYQALATVGNNTSSAYGLNTGFYISASGNPLLAWETQRQINVGFQALLFNRLSVEAEYFDRKTTNMIIDVPYAYTSGFSSVTSNVGSLNNHGVDVALSYDVLKSTKPGGGFLTAYGNFGWVEQRVTELFQGKNYYSIPNTGVTWAVGQSVNYYYPIFSHIDPATGNPLWYVPNASADQVINTNKDSKNVTSVFNSTSLLQNTGIKRYAPFNGGFGLSGGYRGFSIGVDFTYSQGKYLINNDRYFFENPSQFSGFNQSVNVLDYWKKPGDVTRFPKYGIQFTQFDSRLIENASFVRLKSLTVAYNVPKSVLNKTKVISGVKVYAQFRNLLTWTKYSGPDPEVDSNLSLGAYPNTRQSAVGLNFNF